MSDQPANTAVKAIQSAFWLMLPEWIELMQDVAERDHAALERWREARAVEGRPAKPLSYAYAMEERDGVAVLRVQGPVYRYADFFSSLCGGVTVQELARDFTAAMDDPAINSILMELDSPGGEVTGINEFAQMVYEARGKKPVVARVGGMACSAGYWIASAAGSVVIDETAVLGSIGVYTTVADSSMGGRKRKVMRSTQSPNKNLDPHTPEGERSLQARIDALASVFVETVARNRDVPAERVLSDFGQGDVLVGQAAIDAGMADGLGSFEETLRQMREAHGRGARSAGYRAAATYRDGGGRAVAAEALDAPEDSSLPAAAGDAAAYVAAEGEATPPPISTTEKGTDEAMSDETETAAREGEQGEVERLREELALMTARAEEAEAKAGTSEEVAERLRAEAAAREQRERLSALAEKFEGDRAAKVSFMQRLAAQFGEDSEELRAYVADQDALAAQVAGGKLFAEAGSGRSGDDAQPKSALEEINRLAAEKAAADKLSFSEAFVAVVNANPALYERHLAETSSQQ